MPYFRVSIRKIVDCTDTFYIKFLPVNENNNPTGKDAIHTCFTDLHSNSKYKKYKKAILTNEPTQHSDETDYTYNHIIYSRHSVLDKIQKHPKRFLKKMEKKLQCFLKKVDYQPIVNETNEKLAVSNYLIQGDRKTQEDRMVVHEINAKYTALNIKEVQAVILSAYQEAEEKCGQKFCGSTALVCLVLNKVLYLANLGDSVGYLITNGIVERFNSKLHDKSVYGSYYSLNINGAIGDNSCEDIIHTPDIYVKKLGKIKHSSIELVMASDGLIEESKLGEKPQDTTVFQIMLSQHSKYTPEILAKSAILEHGSTDTVCVLQINLSELLKNNKHAVYAVFDGHVGDKVADSLSKEFYPILRRHLEIALQNKNKQSITKHSVFAKPLDREVITEDRCDESETNCIKISRAINTQ